MYRTLVSDITYQDILENFRTKHENNDIGATCKGGWHWPRNKHGLNTNTKELCDIGQVFPSLKLFESLSSSKIL